MQELRKNREIKLNQQTIRCQVLADMIKIWSCLIFIKLYCIQYTLTIEIFMNIGEIFKPDGVIFVHCPNCIFSTFNLEERMTFETKRKKFNPVFFPLDLKQTPAIEKLKLLDYFNLANIHYENKFTKTFRPTDILHIFTKF